MFKSKEIHNDTYYVFIENICIHTSKQNVSKNTGLLEVVVVVEDVAAELFPPPKEGNGFHILVDEALGFRLFQSF